MVPDMTSSDPLNPPAPSGAALDALLGGAPSNELALSLPDITLEDLEGLIEEAEKVAREREEMLSTLAGQIEAKFTDRSSRRSVKEAEWIDSYRLWLGPLSTGFSQSTPEKFFSGGRVNNRPIEHNLVKPKCKTAIAKAVSNQFAGGDKNWDIGPSKSPDIDPVEAAVKAEAMENEIADQLDATSYAAKVRLAMEDRVVLGTGILKGPMPSKFAKLSYELVDDGTGQIVPIPIHKVQKKPELFRVDPWFFFPDDTVNDIDAAEDAIELHPMSKTDLIKLKKNPGFNADKIDELLALECREYTNTTFSEYASLTASGSNIFRNKYAVLEYHGPITKTQLDMLEIEPSYDPINETYFGEVWVCQGKVLRVEIEALAGTFELPYAVCPWLADPGSIFGFGLPQEIRDPQRMANTTVQMMLTNASDSSGSMFVINTDLVEDPTGNYEMGPRKIFTTTDYNINNISDVFKDYQIPNITNELMPILGLAREFAQEESGISGLAMGMDSPSVGSDSATGMAIQNQNAGVIGDYLDEAWDDRVTEKIIRRWYHYNMQFNPKPEILGDFEVDVKSSTNLRQNQMAARDMEKISVEAGNNPEMAKIINMQNLLKARLQQLHIPNVGIIKTDAQLQQEAEAAAANPPPDPAMIELEIKKQEADTRRMEAETASQLAQLKGIELQQQAGIQQQRESWEHDERMSANAARMQESQARVLEATTLKEIELIKLAQKDEEMRSKIMADLEKTNMAVEADKFLKGIDAQLKFSELQVTREELAEKRRTGSGI